MILSIEGGQGGPAWRARRNERRPDGLPARWHASDAPSMMGVGIESRSQLLSRLHSGIEREFSDFVQERVLDPGHEFERRARAVAEMLLDDDLAPVLVEDGRFSTSLDGRTLGGIQHEHKSLNAALRELLPDIGPKISGPEFGRRLPAMYRVQIAHQHLADPECQRTLFGATEWEHDQCVGQRWCWVERDDALCAQVAAAWVQFEADLLAYVPPEATPVVVPAALEHLPAVSVQVSGALAVRSNLAEFAPRLREFIARIPKAPATDQEFADVGAAGKRLREAQTAIEAAVNGALASIGDVNELRRLGGELAEVARQAALACEKAEASGKESVKAREVQARIDALASHTAEANARLGGMFITPAANFGAVIKGLKTLTSVRDKLDTELARAKIECDALEQRIAQNLEAIKVGGFGFEFLFAHDRAALVLKDPEAVQAIVLQRVAGHRAEQERKLEAERARIRAEEEARAKQKAEEAALAQRAFDSAQALAKVPGMQDLGQSLTSLVAATVADGTINEAAASAARADPLRGEGRTQAEESAASPIPAWCAGVSHVKLADICERLGRAGMLTVEYVQGLGVETHRSARPGDSAKGLGPVFVLAADVPKLKAALLKRVQEAL